MDVAVSLHNHYTPKRTWGGEEGQRITQAGGEQKGPRNGTNFRVTIWGSGQAQSNSEQSWPHV